MAISNLPEDDFVHLPKDIFIVNTLAIGIAVQVLAKITGETIQEWKDYIEATASEQLRQLSAKEIEEIVDSIKIPEPPDESQLRSRHCQNP